MKTKLHITTLLGIAALASVFAQGPLTPPGAPGPTMKTLDQLEARTPISSAPFTIAQSGSYYLAANLNVTSGTAITITANNVTLDLNGFKISSTAFGGGTGSAILIQSAKNVAIYNGHIEGREVFDNAFLHGINSSNSPVNVRVTDVSVFGCGLNGINLGDNFSTVVERCTVDLVGGEGIRAGAGAVRHSTTTRCGGIGIVATTASDCYGHSTSETGLYALSAENCYGAGGGSGDGVSAETARNCYGKSSRIGVIARTTENCYGTSNGAFPTFGVSANSALNCYGNADSGYGVKAGTAQNCYGTSNSGNGVHAEVAHNCNGTSFTGTGVHFSFIGAMCYGRRNSPVADDYVLGGGLAGPVNLP